MTFKYNWFIAELIAWLVAFTSTSFVAFSIKSLGTAWD
jgi:hypothetical protein